LTPRAAVAAAKAAFEGPWSKLSFIERAAMLDRIADGIRVRRAVLCCAVLCCAVLCCAVLCGVVA
jgi:acyl-CoA reductase-like NAD-dependent aldehyde dehydrogenase